MDRDAGAMIRDGIKCMEKLGVCPEAVWKSLEWIACDGVDGGWLIKRWHIAVACEFVVCRWWAERDWRRD